MAFSGLLTLTDGPLPKKKKPEEWTRFYSMDYARPSLYIYPQLVDIEDDLTLEITKENRSEYLTDSNGYLAIGKYVYVKNNTLFRCYETTAASKVHNNEFLPLVVPNAKFLPNKDILNDQTVRIPTFTFAIQVTAQEYKLLTSKKLTEDDAVSVCNILETSSQIELPELAFTKGLTPKLQSFLGSEFIVSELNASIGDKRLCRYATSKPDLCFYHKHNYFQDRVVFGSGIPEEPDVEVSEDNDGTIYGMSGEDKVMKGEGQLVANMILVAATVARMAIENGQYFNTAIVFGLKRQTTGDYVNIYMLQLDFIKKTSCLFRGEDDMSTEHSLILIKHYLENPKDIIIPL